MGGNLSKPTVHVIARIITCEDEDIRVKLMPIPNLWNGNDCGFFALVFTSNFTEGVDPSGWQHEEKTLKSCLLQFFRNK